MKFSMITNISSVFQNDFNPMGQYDPYIRN